MAALTITATSVAPDTTGYTQVGVKIAGETITAGQTLYIKASDGKAYKADANVAAANAVVVGIAMNGAATGQPVVIGAGRIVIGATVAATTIYLLSETTGGIEAVGGLTTAGDFLSILGWGVSTTVINFQITNTGVVHP